MSYWEDMRAYGHAAMVMRLYGRAYQLERKLHGGERGGEKNGEEQREKQKKKKIQYQGNITANCFHFDEKALRYLAKLHH